MDELIATVRGQADDIDRLRQAVESPRIRVPSHGPDGRITAVTDRIDYTNREHRPTPARPRRVSETPVVDTGPIAEAIAPLAMSHMQMCEDLANIRVGLSRLEQAVKTPPDQTDVLALLGSIAQAVTTQAAALRDLRSSIDQPRERIPVRDGQGMIVHVEDRPMRKRR